MRDWGAMNSIPEKHGDSPSSMDLTQEPGSPEDSGSWTGVIFLALVLVAAIFFTVYVLAWDGVDTHSRFSSDENVDASSRQGRSGRGWSPISTASRDALGMEAEA